MAEFIDVIAQLKFDLAGDDRLADVVTDLDKAEKDAKLLEARINGLKQAINSTNDAAKKAILRNELNKATTQANALKERITGVKQEIKATEKEAGGLSSAFGKIGTAIGGLAAGASLLTIGQQVIDVTSQFQKFEAVLTNLTGDNGEAKRLIDTFAQFAAETPFAVEEVIGTYVKLRNTGITPTINDIRRLGDIASASGKDLNQLAEALIDAQVGENERLKEFGIRAQKAGEITRFTFRGVTTEVKNTSAAITEYITGLGDLQGVAGSNAAISKTLGGQISNLKDNFSLLFLEIGKASDGVLSGVIAALSTIVGKTKEWTAALNATIKEYNELAKITDDRTFGQTFLDILNVATLDPDAIKNAYNTFFAGVTKEQEAAIKQFIRSSDAVLEQSKEDIDFRAKLAKAIEESVQRTGDEDIAAKFDFEKIIKGEELSALSQEFQRQAKALGISGDIVNRAIRAYQSRLAQISGATVKTTAQTEAITEAEKKRLEAIKDITNDLLKIIASNGDKIALARLKQGDETAESIRQASGIELAAELRAIDERQKAIAEKLGGTIPPNILKLLNTIREQVRQQIELKLQDDLNEYNRKKAELLAKFTQELTEARIQAQIAAIDATGKKTTELLIARADLELQLQRIQNEKQRTEAVADAQKAGADVEQVNELYRQINLNAEREYYNKLATIRKDATLLQIADIRNNAALELENITDARQRTLREAQLVQEQITRLTAATFGETNQQTIEAYKEKIKELQIELARLGNSLAPEIQPDTITPAAEQLNEYINSYRQLAATVQEVNDFIVQSEIRKIDALIAQQERRVSEAQALADRGNAEALEREQRTLETLQVEREKAAQRQIRLNALLQSSTYALAAAEAALAISKAAQQGGGVLSPALVAAVVAAIGAGTGFILSSLRAFQGSAQQFNTGTEFVTGKRGIDQIPAWLTYGERVVTAKDNARYGELYNYITKAQPDPKAALFALKTGVNYSALNTAYNRDRQAERERILSKALLAEITGVRSNLELLIKETNKANTGGKVVITNTSELANKINEGNKKWKI